jgi:hypothetical protein
MENKRKRSFFEGVPAIVLSIMAAFIPIIILIILGELIGSLEIIDEDIVELIIYGLYDIAIAACCYYICRKDTKSIWYAPIICNFAGILSAIVEPNFWITSMWIIFICGWILSIIAAIIGFSKVRNEALQN